VQSGICNNFQILNMALICLTGWTSSTELSVYRGSTASIQRYPVSPAQNQPKRLAEQQHIVVQKSAAEPALRADIPVMLEMLYTANTRGDSLKDHS
jgi:hypothetical protein